MEKLQKNQGAERPLRSLALCLSLAGTVALAGCVSGFQTVAPKVPEKYETLGPATGTGCGTLIGGPTAYNAIPIMLNSRVERAYQEAVASVPGATALTKVTMQENWFWWVVGSTRCVTVAGEAIK